MVRVRARFRLKVRVRAGMEVLLCEPMNWFELPKEIGKS